MTRPQIIRADSIDLQDQDNPSAKDHNAKQSGSAQSLGTHHAETLREVAAETKEERRLSWANGDIGDLQQYADELSRVDNHGDHGDNMQGRDALAVAQNGGGGAADDGDMDTDTDLDDDDMMDKISSSPSIEDEDIDFEFVYALHTFVATVEGQANATKGDTMVLLDDSNSYWWLVRVVKDSSIGYLPAEHIETPTERLARLNKHRNIDLSASMLQDQADKIGGRNPMKSALRRRKKNVTFTAPTYVDYSDFDYSSDEDDAEVEPLATQQAQQQSNAGGGDGIEEDESAKVKPLSTRSQKQVKLDLEEDDEDDDDNLDADGNPRNSDEIFEGRSGSTRTTKNGTVRNTDSFFKDETVETKKITLTPNLLRDDGEARDSSDSKEVRQRPSFEKELVADKKEDKKKKDKDKKEKDKKPSTFRSLFSRKDRKKSVDDDDESFGKRSMDGKTSMDVNSVESLNSETASLDMQSPERGPQRSQSKLQKQQPRVEASLSRPGTSSSTAELAQFISSEGRPPNNVANVPPASLRMVESDHSDSPSPEKPKPSKVSKILHPNEGKPTKVSKAKSRVELDDFDSTDEEEPAPEPSRATPVQDNSRSPPPQATPPTAALAPAFSPEPKRQGSEDKQIRPTLPGAYPDSFVSSASQQTAQATAQSQSAERLSESPVQVSPVNPPTLMGDTSSQEDPSSPVSSPSPELVDMENRGHHNQDSMTSAGTAGTTSTWNDSNLRAFFDSGSDIRDLLVVVYDKTDTAPAGPEHPVAGNLFREQNAKLAEITTQLDNMLGDWLARKQRLRGSV